MWETKQKEWGVAAVASHNERRALKQSHSVHLPEGLLDSFGNASRSACGEVPQLLRDRSLLRKQLETSSLESLCARTV